jgi:hypothetical protein
MIMLYKNFTAIIANRPRKNHRNSQHYCCPPATKNQNSTPPNSHRKTDNQMKLQHNYKIENKITLNSFFTTSFFLPPISNGDLHKPKRDPRERVTAPWRGGMGGWQLGFEWGGGGSSLERMGVQRLKRVREGEGSAARGKWEGEAARGKWERAARVRG